MDPNDIVRAITAKINEAEAAYTAADALATSEFRALMDLTKVNKVETEYGKLMRRASAFHKSALTALGTATFSRPRGGGK